MRIQACIAILLASLLLPAGTTTSSAAPLEKKTSISQPITPFKFEIPPGLRDPAPNLRLPPDPSPPETYTLRAQQKRTCRFVQATYEYEAWVESSRGGRVAAHIDLFFWRPLGPIGGYTHSCDNTTWCPFTDKQVYATNSFPGFNPGGGACTKSVMHACARVGDTYWCTGDNVLE